MKEFSSQILKRTDSPAVLTFIFVVKDWIIAISGKKGYRLLSYVCPQRKYYTPYGKMFFQIL